MKVATIGGRTLEIIDFEARAAQKELDDLIWKRASTGEGAQFLVPVDHRRSGKTSGLVSSLIKVCTTVKPAGSAYYLYPAQNKIREHIWDNPDILVKLLPMSQVRKKDDQKMVVYFKSGWQLIFDGTDENPDKHRGGNGRVYVVDEYDDQKLRIFTEIIRPIVDANKGLTVLSGTPRGIHHLHEAYLAGQDPSRPQWWSRLLPATISKDFDGNRLITDEQLKQIEADYVRDGIGAAFSQEWLCTFNQDKNQVFRRVDEVSTGEPQEPNPTRQYRIGVDPAITTDYWAMSVLDLHTFEEVHLERFQPNSTALGEARTEALSRKYNNAELVVDTSGLGRPIADHLRDIGLNVLDLPTGSNKDRLITNLSMFIDTLAVKFLNDTTGKEELRAYSFNRLPISGRYQFSAPEGKHDDTVIARALVLWEVGSPLPLPNQPGALNDLRQSFYKNRQGDYYQKNRTMYGANQNKNLNDNET